MQFKAQIPHCFDLRVNRAVVYKMREMSASFAGLIVPNCMEQLAQGHQTILVVQDGSF